MEPLGTPPAIGALRLEPLEERHRMALKAACAEDPAIWPIYAASFDPAHFDDQFDALRANPARLPFAIVDGDRLIGMSAYIDPDARRQTVEIGNTYLVPDVRGSGMNGRVKRMMIDHAFARGTRRIEFRIDARNARSQAAVAKLGAVREGVLRAERITWTGHVRDTVLFAILATEWAA